jgi:hypothetical protein
MEVGVVSMMERLPTATLRAAKRDLGSLGVVLSLPPWIAGQQKLASVMIKD